RRNVSVDPGPGPGPSTGTDTTDPRDAVPDVDREQIEEQVKEEISQAKEQLVNASPEEKTQILRDAVKQAEEAVKAISNVKIVNSVTVTDGKAKVDMNDDKVIAQIKEVQEKVEAIREQLKQLDDRLDIKVELTLDLGDI